ncbi:MAG: tRNA lysidine(34) synthetase TilS [Phycisphaerae bacterium]|nr:tRNA lysidine(34) synthetase TilS [Phycisphaerae bacterium]
MAGRLTIPGLSRRDPLVRHAGRRWRELTVGTARGLDPHRRTLAACSGGADSSAMVLALAAAAGDEARQRIVVAHIVHDLRPASEAEADRDAARTLANALGLEFVEASVSVRAGPGNAEARARTARYAALARLARDHGCGFVATAHHADDQLETMLMTMLRGAGPRALAGIAPRRRLGGRTGIVLIRPMLGLTRAELRAACRRAGWAWREDLTNQDATRLRAALRVRVLPVLDEIHRGAARRAARSARLQAAAARLVTRHARPLAARATRSDGAVWNAEELRDLPAIVLGEVLRLAARRVAGSRGADRLGARAVGAVVRAIRDGTAGEWAWPGLRVVIGKGLVRMEPARGPRRAGETRGRVVTPRR